MKVPPTRYTYMHASPFALFAEQTPAQSVKSGKSEQETRPSPSKSPKRSTEGSGVRLQSPVPQELLLHDTPRLSVSSPPVNERKLSSGNQLQPARQPSQGKLKTKISEVANPPSPSRPTTPNKPLGNASMLTYYDFSMSRGISEPPRNKPTLFRRFLQPFSERRASENSASDFGSSIEGSIYIDDRYSHKSSSNE